MAGKTNLGNAAFFAIKGLKKELEEVKKRLNNIETTINNNIGINYTDGRSS